MKVVNLLSVSFFCVAASLAAARDVFFLLHARECKDQRDLTFALVEADVLRADEKEGFSAQLVAHAEAHGGRRLGVETLYGRDLKLHEMSLEKRRDHTIAALDLIVQQRTQQVSFLNSANSTFKASTESVSTSFLSALGIDIVDNSRLPNSELFTLSSALPCLDAPPEMDSIKKLSVANDVPNDTLFADSTGLFNWHLMGPNGPGSKEPYGIDATSAWDCYTGQRNAKGDGQGDGPVIGVVDSGCSMHPDLEQNMCKKGDDCAGYDFGDDDDNPHDEPTINNTHGTGVSGVMAATTNNNYGLAGVCWGCKIMCLKIHETATDSVPTRASLAAIDYMLKKNVKISNHSYGAYGASPIELRAHERLRDAGHIAVVAAGNEYCNIDKPNSWDDDACKTEFGYPLGPEIPGTFDISTMITVGATDRNGSRTWFSNVGKINVDLFAPGEDVVIPWNTLSSRSIRGVINQQGTSFSSPITAGAVGLIWGYNPNLTALEVKQILLDNVEKKEDLEPLCKTGGILNIGKAIKSMNLQCNPRKAVMPKPTVDNTSQYYSNLPETISTTSSTTEGPTTTEAPGNLGASSSTDVALDTTTESSLITELSTKASTAVEAAFGSTSSNELCHVSALLVSVLFVATL